MVTSSLRRDAGMTLVEIMVTMVIASIIAASTFMFFAGQQRIYDTQTKLLNVQQNLWAAMEVASRYTRAAGAGMYECVKPANYANAAAQDGSRLLSTLPSPGPLGTNLLDVPSTGMRAFNKYTNAMQWIPPLWIVNDSTTDTALNVSPHTDILTVAFGSRSSGTDTDAFLGATFQDTSQAITLRDAGTSDMFRPWEFVLLLKTPDWGYGTNPTVDRGCTLFQISDIPSASPKTTLNHGASAAPTPVGSIVWNPSGNLTTMLPDAGGYTGGTTAGVRNFGALTWVSFFIQKVGNGSPNLMMRQWQLADAVTNLPLTQTLAEGIEDLQVSFACDTGPLTAHNLTLNGQLDEGTTDATKRTDEWWNNVTNDVLPPMGDNGYCNLPTAVRITLVARTLSPDDLIDPVITGNGPLDVEDHVQPTSPSRPTDQYRRRVLTTTVFPRNNKPL